MAREGSILDGKYRLLRLIGSGGMGTVWLAEKVATFERFAVKLIHDHAMADESYCARFIREVAVLRGIRHPHIVDVYDWNLPDAARTGGEGYVVMEYLEGETLQDVLRRDGRVRIPLLTRFMLQVLDGIAAVHAMGIVHRDLSPSNIFLVGGSSGVPRAKILDFGLAKGAVGSTMADGAVTQPGSVLGRAAYAAPEIFLERELDVRADIFGCGMIMYRSLTGRFPYREKKVDLMWAERYADRLKQDAQYQSLTRFNPEVPIPIERVVMRAIRKRPGDRYASAGEMQTALLHADSLAPPACRAISVVPAGPPAATPPAKDAPEPSAPPADPPPPVPGTESVTLAASPAGPDPTTACDQASGASSNSTVRSVPRDAASEAEVDVPVEPLARRRRIRIAAGAVLCSGILAMVLIIRGGGGGGEGGGGGGTPEGGRRAEPAVPAPDRTPAAAKTVTPAAAEAPIVAKPVTEAVRPSPQATALVAPATTAPEVPAIVLADPDPPPAEPPPPIAAGTAPAHGRIEDGGVPVGRADGSTTASRDAGTGDVRTAAVRPGIGRDSGDAGPSDAAGRSTVPVRGASEFLTEYEGAAGGDASPVAPRGPRGDFITDYGRGQQP